MEKDPYIYIPEILELFKKNFNISMSPSNLYFYVNKKGFPPSTGMGKPRSYHRVPVLQWFHEQVKLFKQGAK